MALTFLADIRPLFRDKDIDCMRTFGGFDLSKYEDVWQFAQEILAKLEAGTMPPDGAWPPERIATFSSCWSVASSLSA